MGDAGVQQPLLRTSGIIDFPKGVDEFFRILDFLDFDQVDEGLRRFSLAKIVPEDFSVNQVVFLKPVGKQPFCDR